MPEPGWLKRQIKAAEADFATWPRWMQREASRDPVTGELPESVRLIEIGIVTDKTPDAVQVVWMDGNRKELLPRAEAFAGIDVGQWVEATVEREPEGFTVLSVSNVQPREAVEPMSPEQFKQWVDSLPNGDDLPKSDTRWEDL